MHDKECPSTPPVHTMPQPSHLPHECRRRTRVKRPAFRSPILIEARAAPSCLRPGADAASITCALVVGPSFVR